VDGESEVARERQDETRDPRGRVDVLTLQRDGTCRRLEWISAVSNRLGVRTLPAEGGRLAGAGVGVLDSTLRDHTQRWHCYFNERAFFFIDH
jgi:hypothetical protein